MRNVFTITSMYTDVHFSVQAVQFPIKAVAEEQTTITRYLPQSGDYAFSATKLKIYPTNVMSLRVGCLPNIRFITSLLSNFEPNGRGTFL